MIVRTESNFTSIPNAILKDTYLSFEDKGFLIYLLSSCSNDHITSPYERNTIIPRLIAAGYVVEIADGEYDIYDTKQVSE